MEIRLKVFVEEQQVPVEEEYDSHDDTAQHFGVFLEGQLVGTGRLVTQDQIGRIGRVAILSEYRGRGFGSRLINTIIATGQKQGLEEFVLGAQIQALDFYAQLGFVVEGEVFIDGGIPHRTMRLTT
jgi:predicted GNAT family N-acyltransferase